jgi:predicted DNA-binding protein with PD1-like motif
MTKFAERENLTAAHFTAIGAFEHVTLGYFDPYRKEYIKSEFSEQLEVLSLVGNVAEFEGRPKLHAHVVVGRRDATTLGGHLLEAVVRPTLEVTVIETPVHLHREHDPESGLALLRVPEASW